jgi:hypothetical protein
MLKLFVIALLLLFSGIPVFAQMFSGTVNGEMALRALQKAFPDRVESIAFTDNDWAITVRGETFFWANGRLLPQADRANAESFGSYSFYSIPAKVVSPETYSPQFIETLRSQADSTRRVRLDNHRGFQGALYGALDRQGIEKLLQQTTFLGKTVTIHRDIVEPLKRVEADIEQWSGADAFIASLESIEGYSWRAIAETQRLSFHSLGLAIDVRPQKLDGKAIYWLWEMGRNKDWMLVPLDRRWNPPEQVIQAFERQGFIWGGKWSVYDNMHFEYRPELLEYTRLLAADSATPGTSGKDLHHIYPDTLKN